MSTSSKSMAEDLTPCLNAGVPPVKQHQEASAADNGPEMAMNDSNANEIFRRCENHNEHRDAALLLAVAAIATKEIHVDGVIWDEDKPPVSLRKFFPGILSIAESNTKAPSMPHLTPRLTDHGGHDSSEEMEELELPPVDDRFVWNRARAVSLDAPDDEHMRESPEFFQKGERCIVTPESSPVSRRMALRKPGLRPAIKRRSGFVGSVARSSSSEKRTLLPRGKAKRPGMKTILRKKFSWKNYPEVSWRDTKCACDRQLRLCCIQCRLFCIQCQCLVLCRLYEFYLNL